jgi:MFS transporter, BCD family, chlorophyll transporter
MKTPGKGISFNWTMIDSRLLPFADAATVELPMGRLLRLSLFQVTVGMAIALLVGTLNRVMIVELGVSAWVVAIMVSLPLVFAPFRAVVGHRSDTHKSLLGWKRVPYIWLGTMLQFGGFAIMPMALLLLSGDSIAPPWVGTVAAALAFLLVGAGLHTVQTIGLALATDLAPTHARPKVVALLCMMLFVGMVGSSLLFGWLLTDFGQVKLIQVIQGAAVISIVLNTIALWKQEARDPARTAPSKPRPGFSEAWRQFMSGGTRPRRHMVATACGTIAFSMSDVLLEPFGGQILKLSVSATTMLTATLGVGSAIGLVLAARLLGQGANAYRVSAMGVMAGLAAFSAVVFSAPLQSPVIFALGTLLIGFGGGMFAHGTLTATMALAKGDDEGLALGTWGAVQASAAGLAIACGGVIRDLVPELAARGILGASFADPVIGYQIVYHVEIAFLFVSLIVLGPMVRAQLEDHHPKELEYQLSTSNA